MLARGLLDDAHRGEGNVFTPRARRDLYRDGQARAVLLAEPGRLLHDVPGGRRPLAFLARSPQAIELARSRAANGLVPVPFIMAPQVAGNA